METKNKLKKIEAELHKIKMEKYRVYEDIAKYNQHEREMFFLFQEKERLFSQLFENWKHGEMKQYLHQVYSEIKSTEKKIEYNLNEQKENLRKERNELELKEDELCYERLRAVENRE